MNDYADYEGPYKAALYDIVNTYLPTEADTFSVVGDGFVSEMFLRGGAPDAKAGGKERRFLDPGTLAVILSSLGVAKATFEFLKSWMEWRKAKLLAATPPEEKTKMDELSLHCRKAVEKEGVAPGLAQEIVSLFEDKLRQMQAE